MSSIKRRAMHLVIPMLFLLPQSAFAQAQITTIPSNLNVAGTRESIQCRTLLLQSPQGASGVTITFSDLNRIDGMAVFPSSMIEVNSSHCSKITNNQPVWDNKTIPGNQPVPVPIQFPLNQLNRSGEFSGTLLITQTDGLQSVPVTVKVKDEPWLPLFLLITGICLGTGLSLYKSSVKSYDEKVVQVWRLLKEMDSDKNFLDLGSSFKDKIDKYLTALDTALANNQSEAAQEALSQAQSIWDKWRANDIKWITYLKCIKNLEDKAGKLNQNSHYQRKVLYILSNIRDTVVDYETPSKLREELVKIEQQIIDYLNNMEHIKKLYADLAELGLGEKEDGEFKNKFAGIQDDLNSYNPGSSEFDNWLKEKYKPIKDEIDEKLKGKEIPSTRSTSTRSPGTQTDLSLTDLPSSRNLSNNIFSGSNREFQDSSNRLWFFNILSYSVLIALLSIGGFTQLYVRNPTFGANLEDYLLLLAWGFGAEATGQSLAKVLQRLELPNNQ